MRMSASSRGSTGANAWMETSGLAIDKYLVLVYIAVAASSSDLFAEINWAVSVENTATPSIIIGIFEARGRRRNETATQRTPRFISRSPNNPRMSLSVAWSA